MKIHSSKPELQAWLYYEMRLNICELRSSGKKLDVYFLSNDTIFISANNYVI
jgi:hypothetical protein